MTRLYKKIKDQAEYMAKLCEASHKHTITQEVARE